MIDEGPSPLVPSLVVGMLVLFQWGSTAVSYLSFLVDILEQLTGGGEDGEEEEEEEEDGGSGSPLVTILHALSLIFAALVLLLLVQQLIKLAKQYYRDLHTAIQQRRRNISQDDEGDGFGLGALLLVVLFVLLLHVL